MTGQPPALPRKDAPPPAEGSEELFDYALVRDYALLLLTSPARRKRLFFSVFVSVLTVTLLALFTLPKTYTSDTWILVTKGKGQFRNDDSPTRGAVETILSRTNLEALVEQTHLADTYFEHLAPAARLKAKLSERLSGGRPSADDMRDMLTATLEKRLHASVSGDGVLNIGCTWQDRDSALRLTNQAQQNFLASKEESETADLNETLAILGSHAASVRAQIDDELDRLHSSLAKKGSAPKTPGAKAAAREASPAPRPVSMNAQIDSLRAILSAKEHDIQEIEASREHQREAVAQELAHLRTLYTDHHPMVRDALQRQEALESDPPQLAQLKGDAEMVRKQIEDAGGHVEDASTAGSGGARSKPLVLPREVIAATQSGDPQLDYEAEQLRMLSTKYNALLDRIDSAHIDLETTKAAFRQRFIVIKPAQPALKADNLKPPMVIGAGLAMGLILALFASAATELMVGRIVKPWQVERLLDVKLLARLDRL